MNIDFIKEKIKNEVSKNPETENCGIVFDNDLIFPCTNASDDPINNFIIRTEDFEKSKKIGTPIGFYHNHVTTSDFSELDKLVSEETKLNCFLYNLAADSLNVYEPKGYEVPYVNRPFIIGIFDCLILVQNYYQRE